MRYYAFGDHNALVDTRHHLELKRLKLIAYNKAAKIEAIRQRLLLRQRNDEAATEEPPPPANPTGFWCGSQEKIELMRQRIEAGESPFHPRDSEQYVMRHSDAWDKRVPWQ